LARLHLTQAGEPTPAPDPTMAHLGLISFLFMKLPRALPHAAAAFVLLGPAACADDVGLGGPLPVPPWLLDGGDTAADDDAVSGPDSAVQDTDTQDQSETQGGSDASADSTDSTEYYAFWNLSRRETQDPSPFGDEWAESRTVTIGLIQLTWDGDKGLRLQQPCDMHANEVHGSRIVYSANFVAKVPVAPTAVERTADGISILGGMELVGLKQDWTGAMPDLGEAKHPGLSDTDGDGKAGVTVDVDISILGQQQLYVAQRSKTDLVASWQEDGSLYGEPTVLIEQSTLGASLDLLIVNTKSRLVKGKPADTVRWVSVPASTTCTEVLKQAKQLFGQSWPPGT
jgi:hypothetical protein